MKELFLNREAHCTYIEHYSYHFDEKELKELNDYLERTHVKKDENDELPEITMEIVAAIYENNYDALPDDIAKTRRTFKVWNYESETTLASFIEDYLNDGVWDCFIENECIETFETENSIDKVETAE